MANEPNYKTEGGIGNVNTTGNTSLPLFTTVPYQGLTAAKVAALVPKQFG